MAIEPSPQAAEPATLPPPALTPVALMALIALAGLAVVAWMASGYLGGGHGLALAVSALIAGVYGLGLRDVWRYRQDSRGLARTLAAPEPAADRSHDGSHDRTPDAAAWSSSLPDGLRLPVQQRLAGARTGVAGPTLAPYLSGLLVLLGMLGTFLGMVIALQGTGRALDAVADLAAMREALAAPVRGLGLAFGTSVAGVATSAALGLWVTLARRERLGLWQHLDRLLAGPWHGLSAAGRAALVAQQQATQRAADAQQAAQHAADARQAAQQAAEARAVQDTLAAERHTEQRALAQQQLALTQQQLTLTQQQLALGQQQAQAQQQLLAVVQQQVQAHAEQLQALQAQAQALPGLVQQLQAGMGGLQDSQQGFHRHTQAAFEALAQRVADGLQHSLSEGARLATHTLQPAVQQAMAALAEQSLALHRGFGERLQTELGTLAAAQAARAEAGHARQQQQAQALAEQQRQLAQDQAAALAQALAQFTEGFSRRSQDLVAQLADQAGAQSDAAARAWAERAAEQQQQLDQRLRQQADQWHAALASQAELQHATLARQAEMQQATLATQAEAQQALLTAQTDAQKQLLARQTEAQQALLAEQARRDEDRLAAWAERLTATTDALTHTWAQAGQASTERMLALSEQLSRTADTMGQQAEAHARSTLAEIHRLVDAAAEAPRVAAEVVAELRQKLSDSLVRDNAQLAERTQLLETLGTLLAAVQHASQEQRSAIDALVEGSGQVLAQAGRQLAEQVQQQAGQWEAMAAQLSGSAVDVASLGEAFGAGVAQFEASSLGLVAQLERIEAALAQSLARSDDQLAYYVAQAREVIDLSIGAQRQIVDDLQRIAEQRAPAAEALS